MRRAVARPGRLEVLSAMADEPRTLLYVRPAPKSERRRPADTYTWDIVFWCVFLTALLAPLVLHFLLRVSGLGK